MKAGIWLPAQRNVKCHSRTVNLNLVVANLHLIIGLISLSVQLYILQVVRPTSQAIASLSGSSRSLSILKHARYWQYWPAIQLVFYFLLPSSDYCTAPYPVEKCPESRNIARCLCALSLLKPIGDKLLKTMIRESMLPRESSWSVYWPSGCVVVGNDNGLPYAH